MKTKAATTAVSKTKVASKTKAATKAATKTMAEKKMKAAMKDQSQYQPKSA